MATTLEIVNGISQAIARGHDGALDEKGERVEIGLRREEGNPLIDERVMDGFSARVSGNRLIIGYHVECSLKEVHNKAFESEIDSMVEKVKSFIQKEYKKVTKQTLSLTDPEEVQILVEYISRIRTSVKAQKSYKIGGMDSEAILEDSEDRLDASVKRWLELGKGGPRPKNDTR